MYSHIGVARNPFRVPTAIEINVLGVSQPLLRERRFALCAIRIYLSSVRKLLSWHAESGACFTLFISNMAKAYVMALEVCIHSHTYYFIN